jgi:hypothetical protein
MAYEYEDYASRKRDIYEDYDEGLLDEEKAVEILNQINEGGDDQNSEDDSAD